MIYLLKFGASFILPSGIFIVVFLAIALFLWKRVWFVTKILLISKTLFYLLSMSLFADYLLGSLESKYEPPQDIKGDVCYAWWWSN